jgi:hypothetical protein
MALPPLFLIAPTVSLPSAMSATATLAPCAASRLLKACPIPLAPPVTTARLLFGIPGVLPFGPRLFQTRPRFADIQKIR